MNKSDRMYDVNAMVRKAVYVYTPVTVLPMCDIFWWENGL